MERALSNQSDEGVFGAAVFGAASAMAFYGLLVVLVSSTSSAELVPDSNGLAMGILFSFAAVGAVVASAFAARRGSR